ncbi:sodium channel protein type 4 subunit alpha B isoform X2 [Kryptolebias marmoratus]|uniref:sodium channel protein type 4 subunit alpha B isoform X2 n=1 Tax=Kryptolebias marmoratus TaxID=37003 RepID=UPI0018ACB12B|nr:sodium channel protein type 4 subunit alpha B isoform X2 [Kryptolebias marmoratus]
MSWFGFWSSRTQRAEELKLSSSQRSQLFGSHEVRAALQNEQMTSLLPPVGTEVFRRFTPASLEKDHQKREAEEEEQPKKKQDPPKPANHLEAGKTLPFIYGDPPPELLGTPLEDLDPFYQSQKTFIALSKNQIIHRFNAESACYLFSPFNRLRTAAIKLLLHPLFSLFFILMILINCVFMVTEVPVLKNAEEYVFVVIYTFEVVLKLLSRGICLGRFTFFRDPWNWLDVLNITAFVLQLFVSVRLYAVIVIARVMKLFAYTPGLKKTVEGFFRSLKRLVNAIILALFVLGILALFGLQFFMGVLRNKCVSRPLHDTTSYNTTSNFTTHSSHYDNYSSFHDYISDERNYYYLPNHLDPQVCGNLSYSGVCPKGMVCLRAGRNPNYGLTSFDSFGWSLLAVFRILTQDVWDNLLQLTIRAEGKSSMSIFVLIFFPGCFLALSLIVAAVAMAVAKQKEAESAEAKQREEEYSRIVEVLKRREEVEEHAPGKAELLDEHESPQKKKPATHSQEVEQVTVEDCEDDLRPSRCAFTLNILKGDCCSCWRWLKEKLRPFVMSWVFNLGIVLCIILNVIFMAMERYPMTENTLDLLSNVNLVFLVIFALELLLKLGALGAYGYFQVRWNIFDFIVVIFGLVDIALHAVQGLQFLPPLRLLRALRLGRWWSELRMLMKISWSSVGSLGLVLVLVVFMFTVVGMELFQDDYMVCRISTDCTLPRWHTEDFFHAVLLVFRVLCGEWMESMQNCIQVSNGTVCVIFYMTVLFIGNLLVLILFLNLLLSPLSDEKQAEVGKETRIKWTKTWILEKFRTLKGKTSSEAEEGVRKEHLALITVTSDQQNPEGSQTKDSAAEVSNKTQDKKQCEDAQKLKDSENQETGNRPEDCCCECCYRCCPIQDIDTSQGAGRGWCKFRTACLLIVQHRFFEAFIIFIILLSSAALMFEDVNLQQRPILQMVLDIADQVFTYIFLMEMLLKWIALGFKKYFSSVWCWLDFIILDVSLFCLIFNSLGYSTEPLRALRTLRLLSRFKGMRVVLRWMAASVPSMFSTLLVVLFVWLIFSIVGVNWFAGAFGFCSNETGVPFSEAVVENMSECLSLNSMEIQWKNSKFNFDSVGMGFLSLLIMATSSGWQDIMYAAVDSREIQSQPVYESNVYMYLYFILFIIFGYFFTSIFFIRVFIDTLHQHKHKVGGKHVFMTNDQQKFHGTVRKMFSKTPEKAVPRPQNQCQARLFDLVTAPIFEIVVVVLICVYVVVLMLDADEQSIETEYVLLWFRFIVIILFHVEFILKIVALRQHYFKFGLNIMDFIILILVTTGLFIAELFSKYFIDVGVLPVFRLAHICRILPLIRWARGIQMLLVGFLMSLPALRNIGLLFFLVTYTYAYVGIHTFGHVKREGMIDDMFNFETFGNSMISMILISTSSGWDRLLSPIMNTPPDCDPGTDCSSPAAGIVFFTSYIVLYLLLVVHLFIAVILESFSSRESEQLLSNEHLQMFYNTWKKFDPDASRVIQYSQLSDFCDELQDPLRIPKPNSIRLIHMDLPLLPGDQICCLDVLQALSAQAFGEPGQMDTLKDRLEEKFNVHKPVSQEPISSTLRRKQEEVAAGVIQRAFRRHRKQDKV